MLFIRVQHCSSLYKNSSEEGKQFQQSFLFKV